MTTMNPPLAPQKPKLLDKVREAIRARHYSRRTEDAYIGWIKRYIFLYREVLQQDLPWLEGIVRAKRPIRLPVVLTREEVQAVLAHLRGTPRLMGTLLYGAGLRRELSRTAPALGMCPTAGQGCGLR